MTIRDSPNFLQKWGGWGLPSSLEGLIVVGDDDLSHEDLSTWWHNLISLKELILVNLSALPNLGGLSSLEYLSISHCLSIQSWPASDEQSINVEDPLKRTMHGGVPTDDHIRRTSCGHLHLALLFAVIHPPPKKRDSEREIEREMALQGKNRGVLAFSGTGLEQAIEKLKQIPMLGLQLSTAEDSCLELSKRRQTGSLLPDAASVIGRGTQKEHIIEILLSSADQVAESSNNNNKSFSILPIIGLGGVGKTTLAQLIFNDQHVKKHFELMMWVCVSNDPDRVRLTKEMIEAAFAYRGKHEKCENINWDSMQRILLQEVEEKAFLLVLDDVWDASYSMWEELFKPLHSGKKGSKVLVTSRNTDFVKKLEGRMETPILLGGLSDANIWDVFKKYAFRGNMGHDGTICAEYSHLENLEGGILRTLLFRRSYHLGYHDLDQLFLKLKMLRVLRLSNCGIRELPGSIGDLKHLRYLDLQGNGGLERLPESLGNLYNLQVLDLHYCHSLRVLPSTTSQLVNLRHLQSYDRGLLSAIGVGKLTGLQELQVRGRQLRELGGMCMLRQLTITNLEEVVSKEEAIQARLHTMDRLQALHLHWSSEEDYGIESEEDNSGNESEDSRKPELEEEVLQALRPNKGIRELHIQGYGGSKSPDWMEVPTLLTSFSSLRRVSLKYCSNWQVPPCSFLGQLRRLEYLEIEPMPEWEGHWSCPVSWDCLVELTITGCPMLKELPLLPPTLRRLKLVEVGISCLHSELDGCSRVEGGIETTSSPHSSPPTSASLSRLDISSCDNLTSISGLLLPDLVEIQISDCKNLVSLPEKGFGHLVSLKRLKLVCCPELTCLLPMQKEEEDASTQHLPCSLEELEIKGCGDAMGGWWWVGLQRLTSITQLSLLWCPTTIELLFDRLKRHPHPHLPATLRELWIEGYNRFDRGQQSATSSACSSQLSPPPNNVDASAGILTSLKLLTIRDSPNFLQKWGGCILPSSIERLTVAGDDDLSHEDLCAWWHNLISLKQLTLEHLKNLHSLPDLGGLASLETLLIYFCPSINTLEVMSLPTSLKSLNLQYLKNLHSLPDLSGLPSLETLLIYFCPTINTLEPVLMGFCCSGPLISLAFFITSAPTLCLLYYLLYFWLLYIVWEIWLSRNHAINEDSNMLYSSSYGN
ncbi:hypothetical protein Taro_037128 [Colocasia esculenta]|uniref:NB-ARC domain-containing protein n=1 Tax=Colocasia esculenta TaxID=4460 RepID=A0A843WBV8_COLES|nr:hypothetical protein [Colocasia esculenta]